MEMTWTNKNNGGKDQIKTENGKIMVRSDWGSGWCEWMRISVSELKFIARETGAPAEIIEKVCENV